MSIYRPLSLIGQYSHEDPLDNVLRFFDRTLRSYPNFIADFTLPRSDMYTDSDGTTVITADVPGFQKDELDISVDKRIGTLILSAQV